MRRAAGLLAVLLLAAAPAAAQSNGWEELANGWGEIQTPAGLVPEPTLANAGKVPTVNAGGTAYELATPTVPTYGTLAAPGGCTSGLVPYFNAALKLVCSPTVYAPATDTTTSSGTIAARNLTATALATPGSITVTNQGTPGVVTVTYKLVALLADGTTTEAGAASTTTTSAATLNGTNFNRLTWSAVTGAASYRVYRTVAPTSPATTGIVYSGTALTVDDTGLAGGGETAPTANGTGTFTGADLRFSGTTTTGLHLKTLTTTQRNAAFAAVGDQIYNSTNQRVEAYGSAGWQGRVGVLYIDTAAHTTSGTSEEIIATYTLPAGALSADGKGLRVTAAFSHAANTNAAAMRLRFGGIAGDVVVNPGSSGSNAKGRFVAEIIRTGATTQKTGAHSGWGSVSAGASGTGAQTLANAIDIVITGNTATQAGDLTLDYWMVEAIN